MPRIHRSILSDQDAPGEALSGDYSEFAFGHIEPSPMFGGEVHLDAFRDAVGVGR